MVTMNTTVKLTFRNTGTFFGVHVTSSSIDISYSDLTLATGTVSYYSKHMLHFNFLSQIFIQ